MTRPTGRRPRPIHACSLLMGLATALPPAVTPFAACAQADSAITASQRAALAGAHDAVARLAKAKSLQDLGAVLTNKSAGELGLAMTMIDGMMVGLGSLGDGANATAPKKRNPLTTDYEAFLARYGLTDAQAEAGGDTLPPAVVKNGRQFLLDSLTLLDRTGVKKSQSGQPSPFVIHRLSDVQYLVISPTTVRVTTKSPQPPIRAIQEADGQWRIDLGDLDRFDDTSRGDTGPSHHRKTARGASEPTPQERSFFEAVWRGHLAVVKKMLAQNPGLLRAQDSGGDTALSSAVFYDDIPMVKLLLAAGADVNAQNTSGTTPLHDALYFHSDDPTLLALLRKHGAHLGKGEH